MTQGHITVRETALPPTTATEQPPTMLAIISRAVEQKVDVDQLKQLLDLQEKYLASEARRAFARAMAAFQAECPPVECNKTAKIVTKKGSTYNYDYATLDMIADRIRTVQAKHGLSYGWDMTIEGTMLTCVCTVTHVDGHTQTATFTAPIDTESSMSGAQQAAAALSYAKRQSLVQALGITTGDGDTDGQLEREAAQNLTPVTDAQALELEALFNQSGADRERFFDFVNAKRFVDVPASKYPEAMAMLRKKIRKDQEAAKP